MSQYSENKFYDSDNHSWGLIYKYVKDSSKVLDVGCSSGTLGQVLIERKNCIVDGIEPYHQDAVEASRKLRKVYELNVESADLSALKQKYDVLIFADVVEHLVEPINTLKRVRQLLKPGGVILYSIPNMAHISIRLSLLEGKFDHTETGIIDKTHLHFYTHRQIEKTFEAAGYSIVDQKYTYVVYPKRLVDIKLRKLGLNVNSEKAYKMLADDVEAQAFQFIGMAKASNKTTKPKPITVLPHQGDAEWVTNTIEARASEIKALSKELGNKDQKIADLQHEVDVLQAQSARLGHRMVKSAYRVVDKKNRKKA